MCLKSKTKFKKLFLITILSGFSTINISYAAPNRLIEVNPVISKSIKMRTSFEDKLTSAKGKSLLKFKEIIETKLYGDAKVDLRDSGKLFKEINEVEAIRLGSMEFGVLQFDSLASDKTQELNLLQLPYLFTLESFKEFRKSEVMKKMIDNYNSDVNFVNTQDKEIKIIGIMTGGYKYLISTEIPILSKKELVNAKLGVINQGSIMEILSENVGVKNITISDKRDIIKGLKKEGQLKINSSMLNMETILSDDFDFTKKSVTVIDNKLMLDVHFFVVNKRWYENLTLENRQLILDAFNVANDVYEKEYIEEVKEFKNILTKNSKKYIEGRELEVELKDNIANVNNSYAETFKETFTGTINILKKTK